MNNYDPHAAHNELLEKQKRERERVFEVCNANLRATLACPLYHRSPTVEMCLICANNDCVKAWQAQNKLWGISDSSSIREMKALENQATKPIAFAQLQKAIQTPIKSTPTQPSPPNKNLFTFTDEEAA